MKAKMRAVMILAILLAVYCLMSFLIPFTRQGVFWMSIVYTVVAVGAQLYILKNSFDHGIDVKSKFYGFPIAKVGIVYLVIQVLLSFLFMTLATFFKVPVWIPAVIYLLVLAVAAIGLISTEAVRDEVERQEQGTRQRVLMMRDLTTKAASIADRVEDPELKGELEKLAESFRYSDPVSSEATEEAESRLLQELEELETAVATHAMENESDIIRGLIRNIQNTLTDRNRICKDHK